MNISILWRICHYIWTLWDEIRFQKPRINFFLKKMQNFSYCNNSKKQRRNERVLFTAYCMWDSLCKIFSPDVSDPIESQSPGWLFRRYLVKRFANQRQWLVFFCIRHIAPGGKALGTFEAEVSHIILCQLMPASLIASYLM